MASPTSDGWDWNSIYRKSGLLEKLFAALLAIWAVWYYFAPRGAMLSLLQLTLFFLGAWVLVRWLRKGTRHAIWRLRNRLYVTYLFIAVVPICLILILTAIGTYIFTGQIAVYLVTSELERRTASMRSSAEWLVSASEVRRNESLREMASYYERKFPGLELLIRDRNEIRFRRTHALFRRGGMERCQRMVYKDRQLYAWARATSGAREVIMMTPLTAEYLSISSRISVTSLISPLAKTPASKSAREEARRFPAAARLSARRESRRRCSRLVHADSRRHVG